MSLKKRCAEDPTIRCTTAPRCDHHWHYDFRVNRRRYRASTETADKHQARDIEAKERTRILEGRHGIRRQPDIMFRAFAKTYHDTYAVPNNAPSTVARLLEHLRTFEPFFGAQLLSEITAFGIEQFKAKRLAAGCAPGTVNREVTVLKGMLSKAVEWKRLVVSPAGGKAVKMIRDPAQRLRILTPDEQAALLEAYDRPRRRLVRPILELLLITGARVGEILALTWADVQAGTMRFVKTKNGRTRRLPITPEMADVLARVPRGRAPHVFVSPRTGTRYTRLATGFTRALRDAGLEGTGVVMHTLRHTALSRMMAAGYDVRTIMEISGHSSLKMLERYTHPTEQRKLDALRTYRRPDGHNADTAAAETANAPNRIGSELGEQPAEKMPPVRARNS